MKKQILLLAKGERIFPFTSLCIEKRDETKEFPPPSLQKLLKHPLALLTFIPRDVTLFDTGNINTITAPFNRVKLHAEKYEAKSELWQSPLKLHICHTHRLLVVEGSAKRGIGFIEAIMLIEKEGINGY